MRADATVAAAVTKKAMAYIQSVSILPVQELFLGHH
jgi:hypothetical protein